MATLVTGVGGFIGFHVAKHLLARGEEVVGIDNLNDYYSPKLKADRLQVLLEPNAGTFRFHKVDFSDPDALRAALENATFARVAHLGAQAGVRYSIDHPDAYIRSNVVGHANLAELCRRREVKHLVYASSSSVYGANAKLPFSAEDRVDHPLSLYAATKRSVELISECYSSLYRLPQTGLRFFTVYGPWGRPDMAMWLFSDAILGGRPIAVFNNGDMRRDFTYIDDIVRGVLTCLDNPPPDDNRVKAGGSSAPHRLYNIGNNRSEPLLRMISLLEVALGKKALREFRPMQPGDVKDTFADITAIQRDMNFHPTVPIDEGIPRFVEWFKRYRISS